MFLFRSHIYYDKINIKVVRDDIFPFIGGGSKARKAVAYEKFLKENGYTCVVGELVNYRHFFLGKGKVIFVALRGAKFIVLTSVVSLVSAFLFPLINTLFIPRIFNTELIGLLHFSAGILLPFLGFFVYWIYIMYMSERAKKKIHNVAIPIIDRFNELHENRRRIDTILTEFSVKDIDIV